MPAIQKILLPVDFSDRCLRMTAFGRVLAMKYGAELTLLHVVNPLYTFPPTAISGPIMVPIPTSMILERERQLDDFAVDELSDISVRRIVYEGDPAEQLVEFTQTEGIDFVVMPTHGHGAVRRFLIGSVSAKVLHDVSCPVLTAAHLDQQQQGLQQFSNVLCAIDLQPHNQAALSWAAQLAADWGAQLSIVHATEDEDGVERALDGVVRLQESAGVSTPNLHVQPGDTASTVCSVAETLQADVLVIGRGSRDDSTGTLTTTAYSIIRQSPCPVISV